MFEWKKMGLVWGPSGASFAGKHSALQPTPILLSEDLIRVFVGVRDADGVSRIHYVDLNAANPNEVLHVSESPVLDVGDAGCFDENGVVPCAVVRLADRLRIYFAGYMCPARVRFLVFTGVAESHDGGMTFRRVSTVPVVDRSDSEPLFRVVHSISCEEGVFRAWYGAGSQFVQGSNKTLPIYNVRYMESNDGISFPKFGEVSVDISDGEHRVGRPCVIKTRSGFYLMFYGYGSEANPYKLGMASSDDGRSWRRIDNALGLQLSETGWDSEMMAYPNVVETRHGTYMFYNGNSYGRDGFGVAKLLGNFDQIFER